MIQQRTRYGDVFGPVPNWSNKFEFTMTYNTAVQRFRDGIEDRRSLTVEPRLSFKFTAHFMGSDAEDFVSEYYRSITKTWYLPLPWRRVATEPFVDPLTLATNMSRIVFSDGEIPFWAVVGTDLVVMTDTTREAARIASVTPADPVAGEPAYATLTNALVIAPVRSVTHAALPVNLNDSPSMSMITNQLYKMTVLLDVPPGFGVFAIKPEVFDIFDSHPLMRSQHNWRDEAKFKLDPKFQNADFGFGRKFRRQYDDFVANTYETEHSAFSLEAIERNIAFVHMCKGQNEPFWYPEWGDLLDPNFSAQGSSRTRYYTSNQFLGRSYSGSPTHRNLYIEFNDGSFEARRITALITSPNPYLQWSGNTSQLINANTLSQALWLCLYRLASDEINFTFHTSEVAEVTYPMRMLPTREVQS